MCELLSNLPLTSKPERGKAIIELLLLLEQILSTSANVSFAEMQKF